MLRRRRCLHRPAEPCGGFLSLFHRPCAPHCRAGVHARRGSLRRVEHFGFAQTLPRKALRYHKPPSGGRNRPPYKVPASGRRHTNVSRPPGPPAGRCKHRPLRRGGLPSPLRRPCAPHCRAGVHARRGSLRRVEHFGFAQTLPRKTLRCPKPQAAGEIARPTKSPKPGAAPQAPAPARPAGGPEGYLQGQAPHPSAACGGTSPYRGGFARDCRLKRLPCKGSWMRRKAQPEGCIAALPHRWPSKTRQCPAPHP